MMSNSKFNSTCHQNKDKLSLMNWIQNLVVFAMLWLNIVLVYGVICAHTNQLGQDEFYRFLFFLRHPVVIILNSLSLIVAILFSIVSCISLSKAIINRYPSFKSLQIGVFIILMLAIGMISRQLFIIALGYLG